MSTLLSGEAWVLLAENRWSRPGARLRSGQEAQGRCPFCPGNEMDTPAEILARGRCEERPNGPGWRLRLVPNRYPAAARDDRDSTPAVPRYDATIGAHEVLVETSVHDDDMVDRSVDSVAEWVEVIRLRLAALADEGFPFVCAYKNHGSAAGATLAHPHTQILALDRLPPRAAARRHAASVAEGSGQEAAGGGSTVQDRTLFETAVLRTFTPPAPRVPYEVWIEPLNGEIAFHRGTVDDRAVAGAVLTVLKGLRARLGSYAYNVLFLTESQTTMGTRPWRIEILPRIAGVAGFEWLTGGFLNMVGPVRAARDLRGEGA